MPSGQCHSLQGLLAAVFGGSQALLGPVTVQALSSNPRSVAALLEVVAEAGLANS